MSKALSVRTETLPALAGLPPMSGSLRYYAGGDTLIGGNLHPVHGSPGPADVAEARRVLPQMRHLCRAPSLALVAAWCRKLVPHLPFAPAGEEDLGIIAQGIAVACADLPYAVWTGETVAAALQKLKKWPAPADVRDLLQPYAVRYTRLRDGVARIVADADRPYPTPVPRQEPTQQARDAVAALTAAFVAERDFNNPAHQDGKHPPRAAPLRHTDLLAVYDAIAAGGGQGADAAANRAAHIRAEMVWIDPAKAAGATDG